METQLRKRVEKNDDILSRLLDDNKHNRPERCHPAESRN